MKRLALWTLLAFSYAAWVQPPFCWTAPKDDSATVYVTRTGTASIWILVESLLLTTVFYLTPLATAQPAETPITISYATASPISLHEPIAIDVSIRNDISEDVAFDLGYQRKSAYHFVIVRPDGVRLIQPRTGQAGPFSGSMITLGAQGSFSQRLFLGQEPHIESPGAYRIEMSLTLPVETASGESLVVRKDAVLNVTVLPRNEHLLKSRCERLILEVERLATELGSRVVVAEQLSYVTDPIAIPYLARLIAEGEDSYGIKGLERIGTEEAFEAMIVATRSNDLGSAEYAKSVLRRRLPEIRDPIVRDWIRAAVQ